MRSISLISIAAILAVFDHAAAIGPFYRLRVLRNNKSLSSLVETTGCREEGAALHGNSASSTQSTAAGSSDQYREPSILTLTGITTTTTTRIFTKTRSDNQGQTDTMTEITPSSATASPAASAQSQETGNAPASSSSDSNATSRMPTTTLSSSIQDITSLSERNIISSMSLSITQSTLPSSPSVSANRDTSGDSNDGSNGGADGDVPQDEDDDSPPKHGDGSTEDGNDSSPENGSDTLTEDGNNDTPKGGDDRSDGNGNDHQTQDANDQSTKDGSENSTKDNDDNSAQNGGDDSDNDGQGNSSGGNGDSTTTGIVSSTSTIVVSNTMSSLVISPSIIPAATESGPSTTSDFRTAPFVVSGSITVPPQTSTQSGTFRTTTLSDQTGPPNSFTATTTTGSNDQPTILPVWFNTDGKPVLVIPDVVTGPPGIIPPPFGFPPLVIGPGGIALPNLNQGPNMSPNDDPDEDPNEDPSERPEDNPEDRPNDDPEDNSIEEPDPTDGQQTPSVTVSTTTPTVEETDPPTTTTTTTTTSTSSTTTTTSEPTSEPSRFMIFPKNEIGKLERESFTAVIDQVSNGESKVRPVVDSDLGPIMWSALLNATQVETLEAQPIVAFIMLNEPMPFSLDFQPDPSSAHSDFYSTPRRAKSRGDAAEHKRRALAKRNPVIMSDPSASEDLRMVSHGKGQPEIPSSFDYDARAGKGVTVYVIDSGANTQHPEYTTSPGQKRWLFPGPNPPNTDENDNSVGHGSCSMSLIGGPRFGVAKNVDYVIVKQYYITNAAGIVVGIDPEHVIETLNTVKNDIKTAGLQNRAVVSTTFSFEVSNSAFMTRLKQIALDILDLNVPIVATSGNKARQVPITHVPAVWAKDTGGIIVVGFTDNQGRILETGQIDKSMTVWAPGVGVKCMPGIGDGNVEPAIKGGSSVAAPRVAGLAAYLMAMSESPLSADQLPQKVQKLIRDMAWPRADKGVPVLWNGVYAGCNPGQNPNPKQKRQAGGACPLPSATASTVATSTLTVPSTVIGTTPSEAPPIIVTTTTPSPVATSNPEPPITPPKNLPDWNSKPCQSCSFAVSFVGSYTNKCGVDDVGCTLDLCRQSYWCNVCGPDCGELDTLGKVVEIQRHQLDWWKSMGRPGTPWME